ncbi:MAG: DUF202 domain-containing protein [Sphingobium sp.]|jgi:putative membrane protein|nr:DUF202 domain-containing protein [Sphingobium sp.]MCP5398508.1 DUF202 domain-containing protein [Sphingomonas sp.]
MADTDENELAQERTDLAEDRTLLSHERSFAGWVRTGMASVGIALGFNALFRSVEPAWIAKAIASLFLLIAIFIFLSAERRTCAIMERIQPHKVATLRPVRMRILTWILVTATIALGTAIWLLVS